jgi:uncharacterized protein YkwD
MLALTRRATRLPLWFIFTAIFATLFSLLSVPSAQAAAFADPGFSQGWGRTDQAIASGSIQASWMWGPEPRTSRTEPYQQAPGGQRLVQYFDKSRMEINNPDSDRNSQWFVTNGLLCRELVSGQMQVGDTAYENRAPANVPVGGDLDSPLGPTYATFNGLASLNNDKRAPQKSGFITEFINRNGQISNSTGFPQRVRYATYDNNLGHNIPDVFINWMNGLGSRGVNWQYAIGLPITEPYWAKFVIGGAEKEVLVQLFERRALTFNPQNDPTWQVEMGNIGLHYWAWRYGNAPMPAPAPAANPASLDKEEQTFLNLINQYRQSKGKGPLTLNQNLLNASKWMSQDMASHNYMDHNDSQGRDPFQRMGAFGYNFNTWKGENVAAGYETANAVMVGWQNSPHHDENMLNDNYHTIGIARAYNPNSTYKWYWTTDFGGQ